jgi:hypothetical protein
MKILLWLLFLLIAAVFFPRKTFALDPVIFLKVLDIDINDLKSADGDFLEVFKKLGKTKQLAKGDAAGYVGSVEYVLQNHSQMITFQITECTTGYKLKTIDGKKAKGKTVLRSSIERIEAGGLHLGMDAKDVEKVFAGSVGGGWTVEEALKKKGTQSVTYRKTVTGKGMDGSPQKYCDRIWIYLDFDKRGKLSLIDIWSGGCDDAACGEQ